MTLCNNTSTPAASCTNTTALFIWPIQPYEILQMIFGVLSILLNGFLLLAIVVERKKLFVSRITYLVANLALADFVIGLVLVFIIQPIKIEEKTEVIFNLQLPFKWAAIIISLLTLFLMSAERFVVAVLPMLWLNILTTRRTIVAICIVWCLAIASGVVIHQNRSIKPFFALIVVIDVCVLVYICIHAYIVRFIKTRQSLQSTDEERAEVSPLPRQERSSHVSATQQKEMTAVIVILLAVLIFTIIPHIICLQIILVGILFDPTIIASLNMEKFSLAYIYTNAFLFLNFVVNPIVYAWRLKMYRRAFVKIFRSFVLFVRRICNYCFV